MRKKLSEFSILCSVTTVVVYFLLNKRVATFTIVPYCQQIAEHSVYVVEFRIPYSAFRKVSSPVQTHQDQEKDQDQDQALPEQDHNGLEITSLIHYATGAKQTAGTGLNSSRGSSTSTLGMCPPLPHPRFTCCPQIQKLAGKFFKWFMFHTYMGPFSVWFCTSYVH